MRYLFLAIFFLISSLGYCFAYEIRVNDGIPEFARWNYHGRIIWTDEEKGWIILNVATAAEKDFTNIYPVEGILAIKSTIEAREKCSTRTGWEKLIETESLK